MRVQNRSIPNLSIFNPRRYKLVKDPYLKAKATMTPEAFEIWKKERSDALIKKYGIKVL